MKITNSTIRTEVVASDDGIHKYLVKKDWTSKGKAKVITVIMVQPSITDILQIDATTMYLLNQVSQMKYTCLNIVN